MKNSEEFGKVAARQVRACHRLAEELNSDNLQADLFKELEEKGYVSFKNGRMIVLKSIPSSYDSIMLAM